MTKDRQVREALLYRALCLLVAPILESLCVGETICDDELIAAYEKNIETRMTCCLPLGYREELLKVAAELESNPTAIGSNGTLAHALGVELAVESIKHSKTLWERDDV